MLTLNRTILLLCTILKSIMVPAQSEEDSLRHIQEIVVVGNNRQNNNLLMPQTGTLLITSKDIQRKPSLFGEPDILRKIQSQADVSGGIEGFSGLLVRGGENDENLFLLDHLPLYNVSHLGGLFSTFNVATVDRLTFYKSGFPAQFGGRISSIADIRLRESDFKRVHGEATLGILSGNISITAPIIKDCLAFSAAIRRSWTELITIPAFAIINQSLKRENKKKDGKYTLIDANLKLDYKLNKYINGFTHFYSGTDFLKMREETFSIKEETSFSNKDELILNWGSYGIASSLNYIINSSSHFALKGFYSHYSSSFIQNNDEKNAKNISYTHKTNKNGINDIGVILDSNFSPNTWLWLKAGAQYIHHCYYPEELSIKSNKDNQSFTLNEGENSISANEFAVWINSNLKLTSYLQSSIGLRWVTYSSRNVTHIMTEPRANIRLSLNKDMSIKLSYMKAHQFAQQISNCYISLPTEAWQPISTKWQPLKCNQISVGLYGNLPFGFYYSLEGYYKWMYHLLEYKDGVSSFTENMEWEDKLTEGKGWAYGSEFSLHKDNGRLTGNISYALLWNMRQFELLNEGKPFHAKYDNRHKINLDAHYKLSKNLELNASWTYATGNRVTLALQNYKTTENSGFDGKISPIGMTSDKWGIGYYSSRNNFVLPAYHRLDIGISLYKKHSNERQSIWNFGLYNAYSRMNTIAITKNGLEKISKANQWTTKFKTLGLLPVIPSISYTFKF